MKNYTVVHPLFMSFFSRPLYKDVARNWKGWGSAYLLFLLSLYWIPETLKIQDELSAYLSASAPQYIEQMPTITITNGTVSIKEPSPYFIYGPDKKTPFIIIDTTGAFRSLDNSSAAALLTKSQLIMKNDFSESQTLDLKDFDHFVIDKSIMYGWIESLKAWLAFMLYPFALFFSFFFHLVQVIFCASIGTLFAQRFEVRLDRKALIRLAAVSFTPAVMLQLVHSVLGITFPYKSLFSFMIALGYLYYGIGANSEKESTEAAKY